MEIEPPNAISAEPMTDSRAQVDVKQALSLKRAELARELGDLDAVIARVQQEYSQRLEQLQAEKKPLQEALLHVEALLQFEGRPDRTGPGPVADSAKRVVAAGPSVTDAAVNLLEELHQPLHYKDIAAILRERNTLIPGKNPSATLLSRMSRDSRFRRTRKRGTYALSTWRIHGAKSTNVLADDRSRNVKAFVRSQRRGKEVFLFKQPWSEVSLFALGVYGRG